MQRASDGTLILSATDLIGFLACDHLSTLELGRAEGHWERPHRRADPTVRLMQDRGDAHEAAHLQRLRDAGRSVIEIATTDLRTPNDLRAAQSATLEAMRAGADVVYQATFFDGRWRGHADFLYRTSTPSALGDYGYDIADTKLSRGVKGSAILQMCVYADLLTRLQGRPPDTIHVVTGDGVEHPYRLDDYMAYYRHAKARFEARVVAGLAAAQTYPDPVDHCRICVWYPRCIQQRRDDDHPSIVAGMRRVDTARFLTAAVPTLAAIAGLPPSVPVPDVNPGTLHRLRDQARLQLHERTTGERVWELIAPDPETPGHGLAALPEPTPWDLFFDIEADPWAADGGLEYLLGVAVAAAGGPEYQALWGHDPAGEKAAFETFIDRSIAVLDAHPGMHVYHYGGYESGAIKRLMQRYASREEEVDRLLRGGVLVDLLNVVRQGVRASVESYSLKQIEKFYLAAREGPVTEAGFSVVEYERWTAERDPSILQGIADYNRDDCISTLRLRDWLEERRLDALAAYPEADWSRPVVQDGAPTAGLTAWMQQVQQRVDGLTERLPVDPSERTRQEHGRWLLAQLLDWHRREDKPAWWAWHDLRGKSVEELRDASEGIAGLAFEGDIGSLRRSVIRRYRFRPQDHKFRPGKGVVDPDVGDSAFGKDAGTIIALDDIHGTIDLLRGPRQLGYHPKRLLPATPLTTAPMKAALLRVADQVIAAGLDGPGPFQAARDLVLRRGPRIKGHPPGSELVRSGEEVLDAARRIALGLDHTVLPIQGPPGTGKTYTGARMIATLLHDGQRVGVTAQSHKAITNLLDAVGEACREAGISLRAIQRCDTGDEAEPGRGVDLAAGVGDVPAGLASGRYQLGAGTAWLFARAEMMGSVDVLFIDEAGQMSLADVVAMSGAASSIVLLGDPNQLPQVSQGVHPDGAGGSALEHLSGASATIDPRLGLFLDTTWRMHPAVNAYISEMFYDDRLRTHPSTALQAIGSERSLMAGAGIRFAGISHAGNGSSSRQEAAFVADVVVDLLSSDWTDQLGRTLPIDADKVMVVAPYNAHVALIIGEIERRLGPDSGVRVGTVDKFQGQEGAVAIYSMASSSQDDAPRDMAFLYSRNRLNVAVSRARAVALVVANPALLDAACRTPEQMRLVDALCRLVEVAEAG